MRLGLIARADASGLGVQTHAFYRWMRPDKTLVIDVGHLNNNTTHCNKATDLSRYSDATVVKGWTPDRETLTGLLSEIDVLFSAETFYSLDLPGLARRHNVRTVLQCNAEFLHRRDMPDLWAPPTSWMWDTIPRPKVLLPVPVETDRFTSRESKGGPCRHFLHVCGRPAEKDRNGTLDLLLALTYVTAEVVVTVTCQDAGYVGKLIHDHHIRTPKNVALVLKSGNVADNTELYEGDVLLMPRRFGGLCLPVNEALGSGMPCVMPNISPNNTWLPSEWLVPASLAGSFQAKQRIQYFSVDHLALARKIDEFGTDAAFYSTAKAKALELRGQYSWPALKGEYERILGNV